MSTRTGTAATMTTKWRSGFMMEGMARTNLWVTPSGDWDSIEVKVGPGNYVILNTFLLREAALAFTRMADELDASPTTTEETTT